MICDSTSVACRAYSVYTPELDYWFSSYWKSQGELTIFHLNLPEVVEDYNYLNTSFIKLLFNETFDEDYYVYGFREELLTLFPPKIVDRISCKTKSVKVFVTDSTGSVDNVYSLTEQDTDMLDKLYLYRNGYTPTLPDSDTLFQTKLSFYIDKYLQFKINRDYSWVFLLESIQITYNNPSIIDNLFEIYVLNEAHKEIKDWSTLLDSGVLHLIDIRNRIVVNATQSLQGKIHILEPLPNDLDEVDVFHNGEKLNSSLYSLSLDSTSLIVAWSTVDINENDVVIVDYKSGVNTNE